MLFEPCYGKIHSFQYDTKVELAVIAARYNFLRNTLWLPCQTQRHFSVFKKLERLYNKNKCDALPLNTKSHELSYMFTVSFNEFLL